MSIEYKEVGIIGIEYQLPSYYVSQEDVARNIGCEYDKLKIGLDLLEMGVTSQREDCISLALSAVYRLINRYKIDLKDVGKIEVGSESNSDSAKSIKSYLMSLFNHRNISGCDNVNACYGGTNALLNSLAWLESSFCKNKYAIVVCTDISIYKEDSAKPTSGAGAVALLLGRDPVFSINSELMSHYSSNEFDFLKPKCEYPYPILDAKKSIEVYNNAFIALYDDLTTIAGTNYFFDHLVCHTPYPKLVKKVCKTVGIPEEMYSESLLACRRNGNTYTASLYFSLIALLNSNKVMVGDVVCMFSFGSGCVGSMFCFKKIRDGCVIDDFDLRLNQRKMIKYTQYLDICKKDIFCGNVTFGDNEDLHDNGFYLEKVVNYVRYYRNGFN